jgi:hypothetical protein
MMRIPTPISKYLFASQIERRSPAYLLLNKRGKLLKWGGKIDRYGLDNLLKGQLVQERLSFLIGMLPLSGPSTCLNFVELRSGVFADVHLISSVEGDWVIFLDASAEAAQLSPVQQRWNESAARLETGSFKASPASVPGRPGKQEHLDLKQALAAVESAGDLLRRILSALNKG